MSHLTVLDPVNDLPKFLDVKPEGIRMYLLSFSPNQQIVDGLMKRLREQGLNVQYITASGRLDSVALKVRERFSKLIAEVPVAFKIGEKSLKQAFTFEDRLSLWWLNELSGKRSDAYPAFTRICQLEVIREVVTSASARSIYLITEDPDFWDIVASYCDETGVKLKSYRPETRYQSLFRKSLDMLRILLASMKWFLRTGVQTAMAKFFVSFIMKRQKGGDRACAFYTHYPGMWKGADGKQDEKYAGVPVLIKKISSIPVIYACTFSSDGIHQSVSISGYYRCCKWLFSRTKPNAKTQVHLMDADVKLRDLLWAVSQVVIVWRYFRLESNPEFQRMWFYDGVDIFPLIRHELRIAMKRTPRYLFHLMRVRRFLEKTKPKCLVTYHFEFCYGRAMIYSAKTVNNPPLVIGVQHGPCAKRKLQYYHHPGELLSCPTTPNDFIVNAPVPDWIIVEGYGAKELLAEAGYPSDRLIVGGAPRLSELLYGLAKGSFENRPPSPHKKEILVAFGSHDGDAILSTCLPVMLKRSDCHFILKLHPRSGFTAEGVERSLNRQQIRSSYEIATGSIYKYLCDADLVLVTYSSVGMEALAQGYPVVCLQLPNVVNASPILDVKTPSVLMVTSAEELDSVLNEELDKSYYVDKENENIMQNFFGQLDDEVEQRWAHAIVEAMH